MSSWYDLDAGQQVGEFVMTGRVEHGFIFGFGPEPAGWGEQGFHFGTLLCLRNLGLTGSEPDRFGLISCVCDA